MTKAIASQIASEADYFANLYPHLAELMRKAADEMKVMAAALEVIADAPDPGDECERSASYYRIHAAMLKKIAGIALGRPPVSAEAFSAVDQWLDTDEGQAFLKERAARPAAYPLSRGTPPTGDSSAKQDDLTGKV